MIQVYLLKVRNFRDMLCNKSVTRSKVVMVILLHFAVTKSFMNRLYSEL